MDLLLRGATVIDGSGAPARRADVAIRDGRIAEIGRLSGADAPAIDLDGLMLAPGFIDPHTHYDAQLLWDPDITPSSWHGITTVVVGNCGFSIAPTRPEHRPVILRTLENVEGMPLDALEAGLPWTFETFPQYLDVVDRAPKRANVAALIGHTALRFFALGDDATERAATAAEIEQMRAIVGAALDAGAVGFSTSRSPGHVGAYGKPVPSRVCDRDEIFALARVLGERGRGTFESTYAPDLWVDEFAALAAQIGRPVTWAAIVTQKANPGYAPDLVARTRAHGGSVYPQITCMPIVVQVQLSDPFPLVNVPAFNEILELPRDQRAARYRDRDWRAAAAAQIPPLWGDAIATSVVEESSSHPRLVNGPTLGELAAQRGVDPIDVMADVALDDELHTRFRVTMTNDDEDQVGVLLGDKSLLLGLSDAGAHTSQLNDAKYATYLLQRFVRERGDLSWEDAVWRLTGHPAEVYGLADRGAIRPGAHADLVAFDPATVGPGATVRVRDFPAGADRLVSYPTGVEHVWVAGQQVRRHGADLDGVRPGRLLRHGA